MNVKDPYLIDSVEKLREHYNKPSPMVTKSMLDFLHDHMIDFVRRVPFVAISSESEEGLDVSPRGGAPGCVVHIIDRKTVALGDWPGNNKLETISNIITTGRCGLLLLVPTLDVFLRINGSATVTTDPGLLKEMVENERQPKAAIKISIKQAYFHCGKAFRRSNLWNQEQWKSAADFPMVGEVMNDLVSLPEFTPEQLEEMYQKGLKEDLY